MASHVRLLLLPAPPSEVALATFEAAYGPALVDVLQRLALVARPKTPPILDVALLIEIPGPQPGGHGQEQARSAIYPALQRWLSMLYKLVCCVCAENSIGPVHGNDIDFRVFFTYHREAKNYAEDDSEGTTTGQGPIIPFDALAKARRTWQEVHYPRGEPGEGLASLFIRHRKGLSPLNSGSAFKISRVRGGTSVKRAREDGRPDRRPSSQPQETAGKQHYSVAVGGTFDHLHAGHKLLLTATALALEPAGPSSSDQHRCLTVGITGDALLKNKKHAELLESWEERQAAVLAFLHAITDLDHQPGGPDPPASERAEPGENNVRARHYTLGRGLTIKCVEIQDPFGPTITDESISALVVSGETRSGGQMVNDRRAERRWPALEVFEVDVLDTSSSEEEAETGSSTEDFQSKLSSTAIRQQLSAAATATATSKKPG